MDLIRNLLAISRWREFIFFVIINTILGIAVARGEFGIKFILAILGNFLAVAFAFMINDIEDADVDSLSESKSKRNPIAGNRLDKNIAYIVTFIVAGISLVIYLYLGRQVLLWGGLLLLISFTYSWRMIRLKAIPVIDIISHGLMLGGIQVLVGYFAFQSQFNLGIISPFLAITLISFYGQMFNEIRDFEVDCKAGIKHTANIIGKQNGQLLMYLFITLGLFTGFISFFFLPIIETWLLIVFALFGIVLIIKAMISYKNTRSLVKSQSEIMEPIQAIFASGLLLQFIIPWISG